MHAMRATPVVPVSFISASDDGIVSISLTEQPDARMVNHVFDELKRLSGKEGQALRILTLAGSLTMPDASVRNVIYRRRGEIAHHKIAVVGASRVQAFMVNFLVTAIAHRGTRYFYDETAALSWLHDGEAHAG